MENVFSAVANIMDFFALSLSDNKPAGSSLKAMVME